MCPREFRRKPETHEPSANDCFCLHDLKLTEPCGGDKLKATYVWHRASSFGKCEMNSAKI
jgi:hypothetical protein